MILVLLWFEGMQDGQNITIFKPLSLSLYHFLEELMNAAYNSAEDSIANSKKESWHELIENQLSSRHPFYNLTDIVHSGF